MQRRDEVPEAATSPKPIAASGVVGVAQQSDAPSTLLAVGEVVAGKYRVTRTIGEGAFGVVYEAQNIELDEQVALKTMRPEAARDEALVKRFAREAKAAATLRCEYLATVYDVTTNAAGAPIIVMEYLDGKHLAAVLKEQGPMPVASAVEYCLQICEALAVAHAKGIVHRDIKPENLLLTDRAGGMRIVKVLDFGISKAALTGSIFGSAVPMVETSSFVGTPLYMAPERVRSSSLIDARSDIWSVGLVLYELLAGTLPFEGSTITELCAAILEQPPKPMNELRTEVPSGLVRVVLKCLAKDPRERFQTVAELAVALLPFGPKRARLNAERAVAVLQAAGHVSNEIEVNSVPPPPLALADTGRGETGAGASSTPVPETAAAPARSVARVRRTLATTLAVAGMFVVAGTTVVALRSRGSASREDARPTQKEEPGALPLAAASVHPPAPAEATAPAGSHEALPATSDRARAAPVPAAPAINPRGAWNAEAKPIAQGAKPGPITSASAQRAPARGGASTPADSNPPHAGPSAPATTSSSRVFRTEF